MLIIILQRFDAAMWGLPVIQTTENGPVSFYLESDKQGGRFPKLVGRRTFGAGAWSFPVLGGSEQSIAPQGLHDTSSNAPITTSTPPCPSSMSTLPMRRCLGRFKRPESSSKNFINGNASRLPSIPRIDQGTTVFILQRSVAREFTR